MKDIGAVTAPIKKAALAPARVFKDKVIDQNYEARKPQGGGEHTGKFFQNRNDMKPEQKEEKD